jgi:hypothetical protein
MVGFILERNAHILENDAFKKHMPGGIVFLTQQAESRVVLAFPPLDPPPVTK